MSALGRKQTRSVGPQPARSGLSTSRCGTARKAFEVIEILSDEDLNSIAARVAAATPGPWRSFIEGRDHQSGSNFIMTGEIGSRGEDIELTGATEADQDFTAAAREDIPRLLEAVRTLQSLLKPQND
jgi:hypothetical protein